MSKAGILIVEDSYIVAYHLQRTLESEDYSILNIVDSGEEAVRFIEQHRPDLVLMDIMLAGPMDGVETASIIKERFSLPVIYITALTDSGTIQRAKITEPYGYLTKPFEDREIFTVLEMALYKYNIESRLRQSEEKFYSTVRSISDAVIIIDDAFRISYHNPEAERLTSLTLSEAIDQPVLEKVVMRNLSSGEFPYNPLQSILGLSSEDYSNELMIVTKDSSLPVAISSLSSVIGKQGDQLGLVLIFKDLTEHLDHEQLKRNFERERLLALIEGQEKERSRIAQDLHDGLGQMLNAIKMNINVLVSDNNKAADLYKLLDEAIQESVRISENLLPSKLKDFDLATCIRSMCKQINEASRLPLISFQSAGGGANLEQGRKVNLYRIVQEAVTNAIKHARASTIVVQLTEDPDYVQLTIEDNGIGISNVGDDKAHHGIANMRERAKIMNSKLSIESDPKRGTLVMIETPIEQTTHI